MTDINENNGVNASGVTPILSPDRAAMVEHLDLLFSRSLGGKIEITAISTDKAAFPRPRTSFYGVDEIDEAAEFAEAINRQQGWNVYVGAALRKEDVFPGKAADDADFLKTYCLWADADDQRQVDSAREAYGKLGVRPPFVVVTGRTPERRAQMWWPLDNAVEDIATLRATLRGMAGALGTDPKVCTGKQLMRLAGGLNWPKKDGRTLELTEIIKIDTSSREFSVEQLRRAFPPMERAELSQVTSDVVVRPAGPLGFGEIIEDGREGYAFNLVTAHLHEFIGTTGTEPDANELYQSVAPVYLAKVDQVRPGRGPDFLKQKCVERLRAYHAGQIPFMRDLEEAVQTYAEKVRTNAPAESTPEPEAEKPITPGPFPASELTGSPPERRWVVKDWIVEGAVNSLYGDGGVGKTLLAQQFACAVSLGAKWLGLDTQQGSVLAVLCEDEKHELHRRHNDIKASMGHGIGNPFRDVWLWPRVGDDNVIVRWDRDGIPQLGPLYQSIVDQIETLSPSVVILDTIADVYGGNEIDRPQVNYFVKTVLGGIIARRAREGNPLTVLLLGHPSVAGKASGAGFSGSTAWNNAVRSRMYLTKPDEGSSDERVLTRQKSNYAASGDETAIRLFYADGVLHAEEDMDDTDSVFWAAKRDIVQMVDKAWRSGSPYAAKKDHRRYIYTALITDMAKGGFDAKMTRQAIRECLEEGKVVAGASNGKRGYRSGENDL